MYCMGSLTFASLSVCVFVRSSVSVCLFVSECRRFGVCASSFGRSPDREIVFVSFVRAGEAKLRVCVREIRFLSLG